MSTRPANHIPDYKSNLYGWYVATILTLAYILSVVDRQILLLLVGPIERDLHLSDLQFAFLSGGAFGIFYAIFGIPLGWAADRFSRKWVIALAIGCWSMMTMVCGLSNSFGQFMLARIGVAFGEAALSPAAHSMLADRFPPHRLPHAMSLYSSALFLGGAIALITGGSLLGWLETTSLALPWANQPWRMVFLLFGLPGLFLSFWVMTLREPPRPAASHDGAPPRQFRSVWLYLASNRRMGVAFVLGPALVSILSFMDFWYPELFIRTWGWDAAASGKANGTVSLICGPLGLLCAGLVSSRRVQKGYRNACLHLATYAALALGCATFLMPLMPGPVPMLILLGVVKFLMSFAPVLIPSAIQMTVPVQLRSRFSALFLFGGGLVGMSLGPLLPPLLNSALFADPAMMRHAISAAAILVTIPAWFCLRAGLSVRSTDDGL